MHALVRSLFTVVYVVYICVAFGSAIEQTMDAMTLAIVFYYSLNGIPVVPTRRIEATHDQTTKEKKRARQSKHL